MESRIACPFCGTDICFRADYSKDLVFYMCPICGRFELKALENQMVLDENKTASYLFYNCFSDDSYPTEYRYHTLQSKEICDTYKEAFENGNNQKGHPVHFDANIVTNWFPKTFAERIDYILLYLNGHMEHIGQQLMLTYTQLLSLFFIDRKELDKNPFSRTRGQMIQRDKDVCRSETQYMLDSIKDFGLIQYQVGPEEQKVVYVSLTPQGYSRVDALQKDSSHGRNVLVAMQFGNETQKLRNAIRKGVMDAGYIAIFIDEVQHNDFITAEILKYIRDSKFVIADLTHQNNGAYFEEGYAMGVGKPVIQLCQKNKKLHFDIAQKNTIMWETEEDIPAMLSNRIKATID